MVATRRQRSDAFVPSLIGTPASITLTGPYPSGVLRANIVSMSATLADRGPAAKPAPLEAGLRITLIRLLSFLTNYVIAGLPSFKLRHLWYRQALGITMGPGSGIHLGCHLWMFGPRRLREDRHLVIGARTRINRNVTIDVRGKVEIGDDVSISPEVALITTQHLIESPDFAVESRPIVIEDHVWIGLRATIMPGVHIGRGAVVAAGAVVTKNVDARTVVGGIPAREIGVRHLDPSYRLLDPFPRFE